MSEEKRMLGNYEVTQSIYVGDKEVVLAVDKKEQYPFLVCYCDYHNPLSAAWATEGVASDDYLEAMEGTCKTAVGSAEARHRKRPCKSDSILRQQILLDSHQNLCVQSNLQRETSPRGASQSVRLLCRTIHVEVDLNRRMPNGTYGGVRGATS